MIYLSIDIETTGNNPELDQIIEFSAVYDNLLEPDKDVFKLPAFHVYVEHPRYSSSAPFVLSWHKRIWDELSKPKEQRSIPTVSNDMLYHEFTKWLSALYNELGHKPPSASNPVNAAGKNFASFDLQFIKKLPGYVPDTFTRRTLDPTMYFMDVNKSTLPSLSECLEQSGYTNIQSNVHNAYYDAIDVINCLRYGVARHLTQLTK